MSHEAIQLCLRQGYRLKKQRARITHNVGGVSRMSATTCGCRRSSGPPTLGLLEDALKRQSDSQRALPGEPAPLSRRAVEQFEPLRKIGKFFQLNARSARGVVDQNAGDDR